MYMYHRMFLGHSDAIYTYICITECFWDTLIQYIHIYVSQNVFKMKQYKLQISDRQIRKTTINTLCVFYDGWGKILSSSELWHSSTTETCK